MKNLSTAQKNLIPRLQALLVTLLWSSSFIIIKIGLSEIPPLIFAGLRYIIAFTFILPFLLKGENFTQIKRLNKNQWVKLLMLGIIFYTFTQGAQFIGLSLLPSVTVSLWLNFTPLVVAMLGIFFIKEYPIGRQWVGAVVFIIGVIIYFAPVEIQSDNLLGLAVMSFGVLSNSGAAVLGREINRSRNLNSLVITGISMGFGSVLLLIPGIILNGFPHIGWSNIILLLWMAVINTAFAFTLWNTTLRSLSAMESSIINGTMLIQIAVLAWIFLGEEISFKEGAGLITALVGALLVQLKKI